MKKIIISIFIIAFTTILYSQELPEIPIKNGIAYYAFEHKLDNTKKCISKYISGELHKKLVTYSTQFQLKQDKFYKQSNLLFAPATYSFTTLKNTCNDTIEGPNGFILNSPMEVLWRPAIIEFLRKKTIGSNITAQVDIIILSKSEYKLVFKNLTYTINWVKGVKNGMDVHNIGELYEQIKASGKITKSDIKFFENLNYYIQSMDEIFLKAITETYKADDL